MKTFDSQELERLIKGHCRGELDSVHIHNFVRQVMDTDQSKTKTATPDVEDDGLSL